MLSQKTGAANHSSTCEMDGNMCLIIIQRFEYDQFDYVIRRLTSYFCGRSMPTERSQLGPVGEVTLSSMHALMLALFSFIDGCRTPYSWIQGHPEFGFGFKALFCHDGVHDLAKYLSRFSLPLSLQVFDTSYNGYSTEELFFVRDFFAYLVLYLIPAQI